MTPVAWRAAAHMYTHPHTDTELKKEINLKKESLVIIKREKYFKFITHAPVDSEQFPISF